MKRYFYFRLTDRVSEVRKINMPKIIEPEKGRPRAQNQDVWHQSPSFGPEGIDQHWWYVKKQYLVGVLPPIFSNQKNLTVILSLFLSLRGKHICLFWWFDL